MNHDDIDRILSGDDDLLPSSGFRESVMDAVRRDAATPPPIPFPWRRVRLAIVVASLALVGGMALLVVQPRPTPSPRLSAPDATAALEALVRPATSVGLHWVLLAIVLTLASVALARRIARV